MKRFAAILSVLLAPALLSGCAEPMMSDLEVFVATIKRKPSPPLKELPQFPTEENYQYQAIKDKKTDPFISFEQETIITEELIEEDDVIFAVRSLQIDYHKPARFNDEIVVSTSLNQIKKASVIFKQTTQRKGQEEILCELEARVACLTASQLKPRAIPANIYLAMEGVRAG